MVVEGYNATGWTELMDANPWGAAYKMYDSALTFGNVHLFVIALFVIYQFMLLYKTKNFTLAWTTGILFAVSYATSAIFDTYSKSILFVILTIELAVVIGLFFFKKD